MPPGPTANTARWTQSWKNVPAENILQVGALKKYTIEYDAQALRSAGIDLAKPIAIDVSNGTDADHLTAIFSELNLQYRVDGTRVTVWPKPE